MQGPRDRRTRKADALAALTTPAVAFLVRRPVRVQAWREANEMDGRTLMRDGSWLV